jgi:hypothetical protein
VILRRSIKCRWEVTLRKSFLLIRSNVQDNDVLLAINLLAAIAEQ